MEMQRHQLKEVLDRIVASRDAAAFEELLRGVAAIDVVECLETFPAAELAPLLLELTAERRAELFSYLADAHQDELLRALPRDALTSLFERMPSDDRADVFKRLDEHTRSELLPALAQLEREDLLRLAAYREGTVGSVTTSDYASVAASSTVAQALDALRTGAPDKETIYVVYVLDDQRVLHGTLSLRDLVLARPEAQIAALMHRNPVFARPDWPRERAAEMIRRYDLLAVPVTDAGGRMIGIVTVDDAMDIEKAQDAAQLARFGGTTSLGRIDLDLRTSSTGEMYKTRVFWLAVLTFFGVLTSTFVAQQEELLTSVVVLAAFVAPIIDMGGNTGSQAATLVIRAMALGELRLRWMDVWFVIRRELPVALALGVSIALLEAVLAYLAKGVGWEILLVVGLTMLVVTVLGGIIGALLPFLARRVGTDPATLSAPLITSVMDLLGVFVYFGFAYLFLGHLIVAGA